MVNLQLFVSSTEGVNQTFEIKEGKVPRDIKEFLTHEHYTKLKEVVDSMKVNCIETFTIPNNVFIIGMTNYIGKWSRLIMSNGGVLYGDIKANKYVYINENNNMDASDSSIYVNLKTENGLFIRPSEISSKAKYADTVNHTKTDEENTNTVPMLMLYNSINDDFDIIEIKKVTGDYYIQRTEDVINPGVIEILIAGNYEMWKVQIRRPNENGFKLETEDIITLIKGMGVHGSVAERLSNALEEIEEGED